MASRTKEEENTPKEISELKEGKKKLKIHYMSDLSLS